MSELLVGILKEEKSIRKGAERVGIESWYMDEAFKHLKETGTVPFKADIKRLYQGMINAGLRPHYGNMMDELGPDAHRLQHFQDILKKGAHKTNKKDHTGLVLLTNGIIALSLGTDQCVVDLKNKKVIAAFEEVEAAESFIEAVKHDYPPMAICHINTVHEYICKV